MSDDDPTTKLQGMLLALVLQFGVAPVLLALAHVAAGKGAITSGILSEAAGIELWVQAMDARRRLAEVSAAEAQLSQQQEEDRP